jgi:hypothetical protein
MSELTGAALFSVFAGRLFCRRRGRLGLGSGIGARVAVECGMFVNSRSMTDHAAEQGAGPNRLVVCTSRLRCIRAKREHGDQPGPAECAFTGAPYPALTVLPVPLLHGASPRQTELHPADTQSRSGRDRLGAHPVTFIPQPDILSGHIRQGDRPTCRRPSPCRFTLHSLRAGLS